ncbi:hypothetical protein JOE37_000610 [Clavibacter michiganensis]|nr:hypothetical protein [Clavibacter michiganensis]
MTTALATIEYDGDAQTWGMHVPGRTLALPDGFRGISEAEERSLLRAVLRSWGLRPAVAMTAWTQSGGRTWVLRVQDYDAAPRADRLAVLGMP